MVLLGLSYPLPSDLLVRLDQLGLSCLLRLGQWALLAPWVLLGLSYPLRLGRSDPLGQSARLGLLFPLAPLALWARLYPLRSARSDPLVLWVR